MRHGSTAAVALVMRAAVGPGACTVLAFALPSTGPH
jgi:hypothetical protein